MTNINQAENEVFCFKEFIDLIELKDYKKAIEYIIKFLDLPISLEDKAFIFITCGFINNKIRKYQLAIEDFTNAIEIEKNLGILVRRAKSISYKGRSEAKYKHGDYKGSVQDKRKEIEYRSIGNKIFDNSKELNSYINSEYVTLIKPEEKEHILKKVINLIEPKYDLIKDYKLRIDEDKRISIYKILEERSEFKYNSGDYKASIIAIRRAEKYF